MDYCAEADVCPRGGAPWEREEALFSHANVYVSSGRVGLDIDGVEHFAVAVDSQKSRQSRRGHNMTSLREIYFTLIRKMSPLDWQRQAALASEVCLRLDGQQLFVDDGIASTRDPHCHAFRMTAALKMPLIRMRNSRTMLRGID